ncbi:alpha/beta hydrolase family protein [Oceanitalea stevensii]|uniref:Alpha/beta hydrolase n=1 Tax=Oceanitalea stevensii TaxID=2763072 RepID=A0ABR8YY17_9MICO|nr:alpha/beta family hydrolase [Oceanitalea stevensii]MBD8060945.1 alpha/beta hydrolase [Oceanitalea stevensii]
MSGETLEIETTHGPARVHLHGAPGARGLLVLGHGAGGGVEAPDLRTATTVATGLGWGVALVEQPYRVAGRRAPAPAKQLDAAWTDVVHHLLAGPGAGLPLVLGGRSSGARVACRTALPLGAVGVLCLAFPLQPPGKAERPSRLPELDGAGVPTLVVQGERDAFGVPPEGPGRSVVVVAGDHSLKKDQPAIGEAVRTWLTGLAPSA